MKQPKQRVTFAGGPQDGREDRYPSPLPAVLVFQRRDEHTRCWIVDEYRRVDGGTYLWIGPA